MRQIGEGDKINSIIIQMLKKDGRISFAKLAKDVGLSVNAIINRVDGMISNGVIRRFTIETGNAHFILLKIKDSDTFANPSAIENVVRSFSKSKGCIDKFYAISGDYDYLVTFISRNEAILFDFIRVLSKTGVLQAHLRAGVMTDINIE